MSHLVSRTAFDVCSSFFRSLGHVRQATHRATGRKVAVKILPALDFDQVITKDILLDAIEAQKEVILLKVMGAFGIKGVVGLDMVKQEGDWK